jgi:hypothetical protein
MPKRAWPLGWRPPGRIHRHYPQQSNQWELGTEPQYGDRLANFASADKDEIKCSRSLRNEGSKPGILRAGIGAVSVKITHVKLGPRGPTRHYKRLMTICADLAGPKEFMTITVAVMDEEREQDARKGGIARAKEFASHFAALPLQYFPTKDV